MSLPAAQGHREQLVRPMQGLPLAIMTRNIGPAHQAVNEPHLACGSSFAKVLWHSLHQTMAGNKMRDCWQALAPTCTNAWFGFDGPGEQHLRQAAPVLNGLR